MDEADRKFTIPDAVRTYRVSDSTLRRAIREERLPAERHLNKYVITESNLVAFLRGATPLLPEGRR